MSYSRGEKLSNPGLRTGVWILLRTGLIGAVLVLPTTVGAQAYCALRDPVTSIYESYPDAESFRSIVRTVDEGVRRKVAESVPFSIHVNELGRHTLYVPTSDSGPLGLIHVRSEREPWGLLEISWAIDTDLRIRDFTFQRCRAPQRSAVQSQDFKNRIRGMGYRQLLSLLDKEGAALRSDLGLPPQALDLGATVIRSGVKTLLVTAYAWEEPLEAIQSMNRAQASFPAAASLDPVSRVYTKHTISQIDRHLGENGTGTLERSSARGFRVLDEHGTLVGHVFRTEWRSLDFDQVLWWSVAPDETIREIRPDGGWFAAEVQRSFEFLVGMSFEDVSACATSTEAVAAEILILSQAHR